MGVKISELNAVEELQNEDVFPVVQNGETKKVSKTKLLGQIENQIATNVQDISNIKDEQQTQNTDITKNKDDIENLSTIKADRTEIPTDLSQLSNTTTKFVNETQLANTIQEETTARQNADLNLQGQIDAITSQSDVVDVVGTYSDLQNYDTSKITENDIVKVLNDNTHNNATSYFRWKNNLWNYVGSEGPFYTKSETDERLNLKANQTSLDTTNQNLNTLSGRVTTNENDISGIKGEQTTQNNQIATLVAESGHKIELSINSQTYVLTATLKNKAGSVLNTSNVDLPLEAMIVNATYDSNTKELVLTLQNGNTIRVSIADIVSGLVSQTDFNALELRVVAVEGDIVDIKAEQLTQNADIDELQTEVANLKETVDSELEDGIATGTSISVNDSAIADGSIGISGRTEQATNIMTYYCDGTETGDYYFTYNNVNYQFTMPTIETGSILAFNTDTLKLYLGDTEITTTTDNTGTLITLQVTPNRDYPQEIHVVKGHNEFLVQSKNWFDYENSQSVQTYSKNATKTNNGFKGGWGYKINFARNLPAGQYVISFKVVNGSNRDTAYLRAMSVNNTQVGSSVNIHTDGTKTISINSSLAVKYFEVDNGNNTNTTLIYDIQIEKGTTATPYVEHQERILPLTLPEGMELCKIGDYADTFEKVDGIWYKKPKIRKEIINANTSFDAVKNTSEHNAFTFKFWGRNSLITNNANLKCNYYKNKVNYKEYCCWNIYDGEVWIINPFDNNFTEQMTSNEAKAKFHELYDNKLIFYTVNTNQTAIEITDQTLIRQLDALQKIRTYYGQNNVDTITAEDLEPMLTLDYKKSSRLRLDNIESRLDLLES